MSQNKLYTGNLPYSMTSAALQDLFAQYGEVISANIVMDRATGRSRGFGFVEMANEDCAKEAVDALNGKNLGGRDLIVNVARPREENNFRGKTNHRSRQGGGTRSRN